MSKVWDGRSHPGTGSFQNPVLRDAPLKPGFTSGVFFILFFIFFGGGGVGSLGL